MFKISNTIAREGTRQRLGCQNLLRSIFCSLCGQIIARKTDAAKARIPNPFADLQKGQSVVETPRFLIVNPKSKISNREMVTPEIQFF